MSILRRSFFYSLASSNGTTVLGFVASIVLSRLLTPDQIGIYSVATVLVAVANIMRDFGIGNYIVQEKELTRQKLRAAYGLMLCSSWLFALCTLAGSRPAADFYGQPQIATVMQILSLNFALIPFGAITISYLRREMRFGLRSLIDIASAVAHTGTAILLATLGFGATSLAWASIAGVLVTIAITLCIRPPCLPWLPSLRGASEIVRYGSIMSASNIVGYLNGTLPDLLLGKLMGMSAVAQFSRGIGLTRIFAQVIVIAVNNVGGPYFARANHESIDVKVIYLEWCDYLMALAWPFFATLAVLAMPVVRTLFGTQWDTAAQLLPALCIGTLIWTPFFLCTMLFAAIGKPGAALHMEIAHLPVKVLSIILAVPWGFHGLAIGFILSSVIGVIINSWILKRTIGLPYRSLLSLIPRNLVLAIVTAVGAWVGAAPLVQTAPLAFICGSLCAFAAWYLTLHMIHHPVLSIFPKLILRTRVD